MKKFININKKKKLVYAKKFLILGNYSCFYVFVNIH